MWQYGLLFPYIDILKSARKVTKENLKNKISFLSFNKLYNKILLQIECRS